MKRWFIDEQFRSLVRNSSYLALSKGVAAICVLTTLALTGRALGAAMFGVLVLVDSYAATASGLTKFQSWQLIIRYGTPALSRGEDQPFKDATGFAFGLDVSSGLIGMVGAIALLPLIGHWFGIPADVVPLAMLYCLLLPTMAAATPTGVLRGLDRFDLISWQGTATPISRALCTIVAWWTEAPFEAYLAIWFLSDLAGDMFLWFLAVRELRRRGLYHGIEAMLRPRDLPGAWKFAINVNLTSSLQTAWGSFATLIVGAVLGPAAAGIYLVAKGLAGALEKPAELLAKVFYPEVLRLDFSSRRPWKFMLRGIALSGLIGGIAALALVLGGDLLIGRLFGNEFAPAYPVLVALLGATLINTMVFPVTPMLYALDRTGVPLIAQALGAFVYVCAIIPLAHIFGIVGAALAFVIGNATSVGVSIAALAREYRRIRKVRM